MKKIINLTQELRANILELLYKKEIYYCFLINILENQQEQNGELFVSYNEQEISAVLYIQNDGNSNYTTFCFNSEQGIVQIAAEIKKLNYPRTLLGGIREDVIGLLRVLADNRPVTNNILFMLKQEKYQKQKPDFKCQLRCAQINNEDIKIIKQFTLNFFLAETTMEIKRIADVEKIIQKIKKGVFILEFEDRPEVIST